MKRLSDLVDEALNTPDVDAVEVAHDGTKATVDVVAAGPIGVRVRRLSVSAADRDIEDTARTLPERLRALPERVVATEVDPRLGGATLRTAPEEMHDREFFEVEVRGDDVSVERFKVSADGRRPVEFDLTRKQLGQIVDGLAANDPQPG